MTWLHFCTANHKQIGRLTLVDMSDWFEAGLLELGHKVTFSETHLESGAINILWDYFTPRFARDLLSSGVTYGLVGTEIPDGVGFNWRTEPEWQTRFQTFKEVAQKASFIWAQIELTAPFYAQLAPTTFTALGFSDRLVPSYLNEEPDRDFCFFGQKTPYREEAVARIRKHATVEWPDKMLMPEDVGRLIARSRIGISLKQSPQWPVPSPPRLGRLMLAKRGVAAEHVEVPTQQGEIVGLCPKDRDFIDYSLDLLNNGWRQRAEQVFDTYKQEMPMKLIMERALDETVSGLPRASATVTTADRLPNGTTTDFVEQGQQVAIRQEEEAPQLLGSVHSYNIVHYWQHYIAVPISNGEVDLVFSDPSDFCLAYINMEQLKQHQREEPIIVETKGSRDKNVSYRIRGKKNGVFHTNILQTPLLFLTKENLISSCASIPDHHIPKTVAINEHYNLLRYKNFCIALPLQIGPVDLTALDVECLPQVFTGKGRDRPLKRAAKTAEIEFVGRLRDRDVIRYFGLLMVLPAHAERIESELSTQTPTTPDSGASGGGLTSFFEFWRNAFTKDDRLFVVKDGRPPNEATAESLRDIPLIFRDQSEAKQCLGRIYPETSKA